MSLPPPRHHVQPELRQPASQSPGLWGLPVWQPQPSCQSPRTAFLCLVPVSKFSCHRLPGGCGLLVFFLISLIWSRVRNPLAPEMTSRCLFPFISGSCGSAVAALLRSVCPHQGWLLQSSWLAFEFQDQEQGEGPGIVHSLALIRAIAFSRHLVAY